MSRRLLSVVALLAASASAQTFTSCNPLNATCPANPALGTTYTTTFNASQTEFDPALWNVTSGASLITFSDAGAELPILKKGDTVTVQSNFYIFWGTLEIMMKASPGTGIISTAILLSDDLDEIDWEIMGGNSSFVENNYYGWGNTTQYNAEYEPLDGAQTGYHNYTIDWTEARIEYSIDGRVVRTIPKDAPGKYPQTPMYISMGIWAGGASSAPGTVAWAGGETDFSQAPFSMYIQSLRITDGSPNSTSYSYTDTSGSATSISATPGTSAAYKALHRVSAAQQAAQRWNALSTGAKIGIACGVLGALAIGLIAFAAYCVVQRKRGRAEKAAADKEWDKERDELLAYKRMMAGGGFAVQGGYAPGRGGGEKF